MKTRFSQGMADCFDAPDRKRRFNEELFTEVAPRYDMITRILSFGRDHAWKGHLIAALPNLNEPTCVDLACGTGDLCQMLAVRYPQARVVGVDLTASMLAIARERHERHIIDFRIGDMGALDLPDAFADLVTGSYALRNAPDVELALNEAMRILKPGGTAAFLDFSRPVNPLMAGLEYGTLKAWGSLWGVCLHRNPQVYGYIAESLRYFPNRQQLRKLVNQCGFLVEKTEHFFGGVIELIVLKRPETGQEPKHV